MIITKDSTTILLVRSGIISLHDIVLIGFIFLPKLNMIKFGIAESESRQNGSSIMLHYIKKVQPANVSELL